MTLPLAYPHPTGQVNPITVRAAAALPAAGAWDTAPLEIITISADWITFYFTYTRHAQAIVGVFDFKIEYSPYSSDQAGVEDWFDGSAFAIGAVVSGADTQSEIQAEYVTYASNGAAAEMVIFGPMRLERTIERLRLFARESENGDTDNPGTLHVVAVWNGE